MISKIILILQEVEGYVGLIFLNQLELFQTKIKINQILETKNEAEKLKAFIDITNFSISASSLRFYSGDGLPDTKALSSVLLLNTDSSKSQVLTEVSYSLTDEAISQKIYELFKDDYFEFNMTLKSVKIKFRIDPWKEGKNEIKLNEGINFVWADKNPSL